MIKPLFPATDSTALRDEASQLVTQEEFESILQKMQGYMSLPVGNLAKEDELYLEQQLSELFGFEVMAELEQFRLPQTLGVVAAKSHLRRHPADSLADHDQVREAGLSSKRSAFGWFSDLGSLTTDMQWREQYWISLPVELLISTSQNSSPQNVREWLKWRKVCVLNPISRRAVVAVIGDTDAQTSLTEQYGGSPEVMRYTQAWTTENAGKLMIFLVNDPQNQVALGPRLLSYDYR